MARNLLTTEELAARLRKSPSTIRYWRMKGIGPRGVVIGRHVLYDEAECDAWIESRFAAQGVDATGAAANDDSPP
jgi:predicted DNA-binding transcriptional regulator AlpA